MKLLQSVIATSLVFSPLAAVADTPATAADPHALCDGQIELVRFSKIKPTGSIAGFLDTVKDNNAWYRSHGIKSNMQVAARELKYDETNHVFSVADDEIVTIHINPPRPNGASEDEAWKAFVKKYDDNSEITAAKMICVPKEK